jgi:hypothetical protein
LYKPDATGGTIAAVIAAQTNYNSWVANNGGNFGIGTVTPTTKLEVNGTVSASNVYVTATTGTVSATYGYFKYISGTLASSALSGALALDDLTDVSASSSAGTIMAGPGVPMSTDTTVTTAFGGFAFGHATAVGYGNSAFGYGTLYSNAGGYYNTGLGAYALFFNTTGISNAALGVLSVYANTTGAGNVGVGHSALQYNTTGSRNVALGMHAGQGVSGSTAISNSVLVGYGAGLALTTGGGNTLLGYQAGDNLTTGSNNIIIGYNLDAGSATGSNQLNIGNAVYGNIGSGTGNANLIGINVSSPTTALEVAGTVSASNFVGDGSGLTGLSLGSLSAAGSAGSLQFKGVGNAISGTSDITWSDSDKNLAVSGTAQLAGSGAESCGAGSYGKMRFVDTGGGAYGLQLCRP